MTIVVSIIGLVIRIKTISLLFLEVTSLISTCFCALITIIIIIVLAMATM